MQDLLPIFCYGIIQILTTGCSIKKISFKMPLWVSEKSPWESHVFFMCGQISGLDAAGG